MKTTLILDDRLLDRLRREALRRKMTLSGLVEAALRLYLQRSTPRIDLPELPSFDSGGALVDVADREALFRAMEGG